MKNRFQRIREIRNLPSASLRVIFFGLVMLSGMGALAAKLWKEQTAQHAKWVGKIKSVGKVIVRIPSNRGDILDRNGWVLAENRASYGVDFYLPEMVEAMKDTVKERNKEKLAKLHEEGKHLTKKEIEETLEKLPLREVDVARGEMMARVSIPHIVTIIKNEVQPKLYRLGLDDDPAAKLDFNASILEKHYFAREHVPFAFLENVKFDTVAKISENDLGLAGVDPCMRPVRHYLYGAFACHMLGYVGNTKDEAEEADYYTTNDRGEKKPAFDYYKADIVGQYGIEKHCDKWLRGKPGQRILERSAKGKTGAETGRIEPTPGNNVYLTIDARIQMSAEKALRESGVGRAAVVVVDPNNGDILAMACVPNYDANTFVEKLDELEQDETDPLTPRCTQSYPPGSTFKQITALAGLRGGISPTKTWSCTGGVTYGNRLMKCTGSHGSMNMSDGIMKSCNSYFYQMSNAIGTGSKDGFAQVEAVGQALGLGMKSGLPLDGETAGLLPGPKYFTSKGLLSEMDSGGQLANTSIGQGKVSVSPLQMAMITASVANGGKSYYPRLVSRVVDSERNDVRDENGELVVPVEPKLRANLLDIGLKASDIEILRKGMWRVVNDGGGTGQGAKIKGIEVAGKTGTAQVSRRLNERDAKGNWVTSKDYHVWFTEFAPYKDTRFAICVMVESGGDKARGGSVAAPIATKVMREALALVALDKKEESDEKLRPALLTAVAGNFTPVSRVTMAADGTLSKIVADGFKDERPGAPRATDDEPMDHDENAPVLDRKRTEAAIAAKKAADARGTMKASDKPVRQPTWFERTVLGRKPISSPSEQPRTR